MESNKQIHSKIMRYRQILRQIRHLRKERNDILKWLDRATRGEEYWEEDTASHIDKIERETRNKF